MEAASARLMIALRTCVAGQHGWSSRPSSIDGTLARDVCSDELCDSQKAGALSFMTPTVKFGVTSRSSANVLWAI